MSNVSFRSNVFLFEQTVAADATETLESIDQTLDEPLVQRRNNPNETANENENEENNTAQVALIDPDTGIPLEDNSATPNVTNATILLWKSPTEATLQEMKERLVVSCEDVFSDPLEQEQQQEEEENKLASFLDAFDLDTKTEEISVLLKSDAALQTTFSMLSDSVAYKDFWTRYYFRIDTDEKQLLKTYSHYYQNHLEAIEKERAEQEQEKAAPRASKTMGMGLTSFLGGVVSKLTTEHEHINEHEIGNESSSSSSSSDPDTSGMVDESMDQTTVDSNTEDGAVAAARSALGFFSSTVAGASGRPPFVMNTVVSDDEEDYDDNENDELRSPPTPDEDEDSEVELGWDDDDEDFDDDDSDTAKETEAQPIAFLDGDDRSETVDFKDAEKENLLEELEQAREERDALQKTVQMQADELQKVAAQNENNNNNSSSNTTVTNSSSINSSSEDALKLQLFEKDAELAALRSTLHDQQEDEDEDENKGKSIGWQKQVNSLKEALQQKDHDFENLKKATQAQTKTLEQKLEDESNQQQELLTLKESLNDRDSKLLALETKMSEDASNLRHQIEKKQNEKEEMVLALQSQVYALERQLEEKQTANNNSSSSSNGNGDEETAAAGKDNEINASGIFEELQAEIFELKSDAEEASVENEKLAAKLEAKTQEVDETKAQLEALMTNIEAKAQEATSSKVKIEALQTQLDAKTQEAETALVETENLQSVVSEKTQEAENALVETGNLKAIVSEKTREAEATVSEIKNLQSIVSNLQTQLSRKDQQASGSASENQIKIVKLESQLTSKDDLLKSQENKIEGLQTKLLACQEEAKQKLQQASNQHAVSMANLETKLSSLSQDLAVSKEDIHTAKHENKTLKSELEQLRASLDQASLHRPTSPGSNSTGVRVDVPMEEEPAAAVAAPLSISNTPNATVPLGLEPSENNGDDGDDDGWGDDW